jgi:hypothetical protein
LTITGTFSFSKIIRMLTALKKRFKRNPWIWYNIRNRGNHLYSVELGSNLQQVVDDLNIHGIAKSEFSLVFPDIDWDYFEEKVKQEVTRYESAGKISEHEDKSYMNFVLGLNPDYDADSLWSKVSEHPSLSSIASAYFQMKKVEMRYYNIWKHDASEGEAKGSQLWHRDREDVKIMKVFICVEEVDDKRGPFVYAPGTHLEGKIKGEPEYIVEKSGTHRTTDSMMKKLVPQSDWVWSTGKKGTIVFADTNGYHKGGYVKEGYRLLFTCMYVSPVSERHYFSRK